MSFVSFARSIAPSSDATRKCATASGRHSSVTSPRACASASACVSRSLHRENSPASRVAEPLVHVRRARRPGSRTGTRPRSSARAWRRGPGPGSSGSEPAARLVGVREARLDARAPRKASIDPVEDRVAEVFLAPEVVVEVALSDPAGSRSTSSSDVLLVALEVDQAGRRLDQDLPGRLPFALAAIAVCASVPTGRYNHRHATVSGDEVCGAMTATRIPRTRPS